MINYWGYQVIIIMITIAFRNQLQDIRLTHIAPYRAALNRLHPTASRHFSYAMLCMLSRFFADVLIMDLIT